MRGLDLFESQKEFTKNDDAEYSMRIKLGMNVIRQWVEE
jgi:hypothetical protein